MFKLSSFKSLNIKYNRQGRYATYAFSNAVQNTLWHMSIDKHVKIDAL